MNGTIVMINVAMYYFVLVTILACVGINRKDDLCWAKSYSIYC